MPKEFKYCFDNFTHIFFKKYYNPDIIYPVENNIINYLTIPLINKQNIIINNEYFIKIFKKKLSIMNETTFWEIIKSYNLKFGRSFKFNDINLRLGLITNLDSVIKLNGINFNLSNKQWNMDLDVEMNKFTMNGLYNFNNYWFYGCKLGYNQCFYGSSFLVYRNKIKMMIGMNILPSNIFTKLRYPYKNKFGITKFDLNVGFATRLNNDINIGIKHNYMNKKFLITIDKERILFGIEYNLFNIFNTKILLGNYLAYNYNNYSINPIFGITFI